MPASFRYKLPQVFTEVKSYESSPDAWQPQYGSPPYLLYDAIYATVAFAVTHLLLHASVLVAGVTCAVVFAVCRALPTVDHAALLEAERRLLSTCPAAEHRWSKFHTAHAAWQLHSLRVPYRGGGPPRGQLVLIHGHSSGAAHWEAVLGQLAEVTGHDIWVIDMPGWGRSPAPPALTRSDSPGTIVSLYQEMLAGWMAANKLSGLILMGHSMGGYLAVQFASAHPELVKQLILVSPAGLTPMVPGDYSWGIYFKYFPPQRIARTFGRLGYVVFRWLYQAFVREDPRMTGAYYLLAAASGWAGCADIPSSKFLRFTLRGGLYWTRPCLSQLLECDMPVSVIWGAADDMLPPIIGPLLHRIRPRTDLYLLQGALHNPAHNNRFRRTEHTFVAAVADCIFKRAGLPRLTVAGHDGQQFGLGDADALLEPAAEPTGPAVPHDGLLSSNLSPLAARVPSRMTLQMETDAAAAAAAAEAEADNTDADSAAGGDSCGSSVHSIFSAGSSSGYGASEAHQPRPRGYSSMCGYPYPAVNATAPALAPTASAAVAAAVAASAVEHDGIGSELGVGRGHCMRCHHAVHLYKSYWRCGCAAWSFNTHVRPARTREAFAAFLQFMDDLYVDGTFDALTNSSIVMKIKPRTPFPPAASQAQHQYQQHHHHHHKHGLGHTLLSEEISSAAALVSDTVQLSVLAAQHLLESAAQMGAALHLSTSNLNLNGAGADADADMSYGDSGESASSIVNSSGSSGSAAPAPGVGGSGAGSGGGGNGHGPAQEAAAVGVSSSISLRPSLPRSSSIIQQRGSGSSSYAADTTAQAPAADAAAAAPANANQQQQQQQQPRSRHVPRSGTVSMGIHLQPKPAPFPRGDVFLLT